MRNPKKQSKCERCGATIFLVKTGPETRKWITNPHKVNFTWKCGSDPQFPMQVHKPVEWLP